MLRFGLGTSAQNEHIFFVFGCLDHPRMHNAPNILCCRFYVSACFVVKIEWCTSVAAINVLVKGHDVKDSLFVCLGRLLGCAGLRC
jgi:hypothetical protein